MSKALARRSARTAAPPESQQRQGVAGAAAAGAAARRRADLEAAFALFGTLETDAHDERADAPYRAGAASGTAANDAMYARALPQLTGRGVYLDPKLPLHLVQALDWLAVAGAAEFAARWGAGVSLTQMSIATAAAFIVTALCLKAGLWLTDSYRVSPSQARPERGLAGLTLGAFRSLAAANLLAPGAREAAALSATLPAVAALLACAHAAMALWVRGAHRRGVFAETIVLVGATDAAARFIHGAGKTGEARIVAVIDDRDTRAPRVLAGKPVSGSIDALLAWDGLPHIDRIVIAVPAKAEARVSAIADRLRAAPQRIEILFDYNTQSMRGPGSARIAGMAAASVAGRPRRFYRAVAKRAFDVFGAALATIVLAAPMLVVAAAVKLDSRGPALHRQRRYGLNNRVITVLKFRTMRADNNAPVAPANPNDPRITRVGRWLRSANLDALPQLFNVLRGDMSLVGPHPHLVGLRAGGRAAADIVAGYAHRHRVKPGLAGWAHINGARGPIKTPACLHKRVRLDLDYAARASLWLDLQILWRSFGAPRGGRSR